MRIERWFYMLPLRLRTLFRGAAVDQELDEELRDHVEQQVAHNIQLGMTPDAARTAALRALGGLELRKEELRDQQGWTVLDDLRRDLRHAGRVLRASPLFTLVAITTLALGIGANAAIFQLIDVVRLRLLPVEAPHELVEVRMADDVVHSWGVTGNFDSQMTYPLWEQIQQHQRAFTGVFAFGSTRLVAGRGAEARALDTLWVSGEFFPVLRVRPALGRLLAAVDDQRGCGAGPVVISHAFWQTQFGGSPVIGRTLAIQDHTFTIAGVTPQGFTGLEVGRGFDVALPTCAAALWSPDLDLRHRWWLTVIGRLRPDWTLAQASDHFRTLSPPMLNATMPEGFDAANTARYLTFRMEALPASRGISQLRAAYATPLWLLLGTTGLVLLITCGNLATLMLARAHTREREITVRIALGASRRRIVSQLTVESLFIAAGGAAVAIPVALLSSRALARFLGTTLNLVPDWRMVSFTVAVAMLTVLLFGLLPALRASLINPTDAMRHGCRGVTGDRRRSAFQRVLVAGQVSVSLVLVASALLFVRSFQNLATVDTGFAEDGLLIMSFLDRTAGGRPIGQRVAFQQALTEEIRSTPGVVAAAASTHQPLGGTNFWHFFRPTGVPVDERQASPWTYVSPGYFETMKIPLVAGRDFRPTDTMTSTPVAIVNEAFVRQHLGGRQPLGIFLNRFAEPGYPATGFEIVGVVRDTLYTDVRAGLFPIVFAPITQDADLWPWASVIVRSDGRAGIAAAIGRRVQALNGDIAVGFTTLSAQMVERLSAERMLAWLGGSFGILSMTLASIGLYGLIAYLALGRTHEIGIRLSLGATRANVVAMFLRTSARPIVHGLVLGLPITVLLMRSASTILFGLSPTDTTTLAIAVVLLAAAGGVAAFVPAWRAAQLDPTIALRSD